MKRIKTVFHVHTDYSPDGETSVEELLADARAQGIGCLAITDHDTIAGARYAARLAGGGLRIIVGEEITTRDGHLIGLFLREPIRPGLSLRRTAELIRAQGGLVVAPHPFNRIFNCGLRDKLYEILDLLDVVEVCNAQNLLPFPNRRAAAFARGYGFPQIVGVDAHFRGSLGACCQLLPPFDGPQGFLAALRRAELIGGRQPLSYFARSAWLITRYLLGWGLPSGFGRNAEVARGDATTADPVRVADAA